MVSGADANAAPLPQALSAVANAAARLPEGLQAHILRTREIGRVLAPLVNADPAKVDLALAAHDLCRAATREKLLQDARALGREIDAIEAADPMLLHGPLAAGWLRQTAGVADRSVLDAVAWHTTLWPEFDGVGLAVFLADKIDPEKVARRPWLASVRDLAMGGSGLRAAESYLSRTLGRLIESGGIAHPRGLQALNALRLKLRALD